MIVNDHYGKIVKYQTAGVELELIIVEFPVTDKPGVARCIDSVGTRHTGLAHRIKGTGQKKSGEEIAQIAARAFCLRNTTGTGTGGQAL